MKKILIAAALAATFTSGSAMAQAAGMGFKAGTTRDAAMATAAKAFSRMDANSDGTLDNEEVTKVLTDRAAKAGKTFKPKAAARTISRNDGNGDGKVTLDEFKTAAGTRFDGADANKNGTIDADEGKPAAGGAAGGDDNS